MDFSDWSEFTAPMWNRDTLTGPEHLDEYSVSSKLQLEPARCSAASPAEQRVQTKMWHSGMDMYTHKHTKTTCSESTQTAAFQYLEPRLSSSKIKSASLFLRFLLHQRSMWPSLHMSSHFSDRWRAQWWATKEIKCPLMRDSFYVCYSLTEVLSAARGTWTIRHFTIMKLGSSHRAALLTH